MSFKHLLCRQCVCWLCGCILLVQQSKVYISLGEFCIFLLHSQPCHWIVGSERTWNCDRLYTRTLFNNHVMCCMCACVCILICYIFLVSACSHIVQLQLLGALKCVCMLSELNSLYQSTLMVFELSSVIPELWQHCLGRLVFHSW